MYRLDLKITQNLDLSSYSLLSRENAICKMIATLDNSQAPCPLWQTAAIPPCLDRAFYRCLLSQEENTWDWLHLLKRKQKPDIITHVWGADEKTKRRELGSAHISATTAASLAHPGTSHQRNVSDNDHRTSLLGSERTEMFEGLFHGPIDSDSTAVQGLQHFIFQRTTTHTVNKLLTRPALVSGFHYLFYFSDSCWLEVTVVSKL